MLKAALSARAFFPPPLGEVGGGFVTYTDGPGYPSPYPSHREGGVLLRFVAICSAHFNAVPMIIYAA